MSWVTAEAERTAVAMVAVTKAADRVEEETMVAARSHTATGPGKPAIAASGERTV